MIPHWKALKMKWWYIVKYVKDFPNSIKKKLMRYWTLLLVIFSSQRCWYSTFRLYLYLQFLNNVTTSHSYNALIYANFIHCASHGCSCNCEIIKLPCQFFMRYILIKRPWDRTSGWEPHKNDRQSRTKHKLDVIDV